MIRKEVKEVRVDTTVHEKNITYPTDLKLYEKTIQLCIRITNSEGIKIKNYLKGTAGDQINTLLAASAYNMMKWIRMKREGIFIVLWLIYYWILIYIPVNIQAT